MTIHENKILARNIEKLLDRNIPIRLGVNKKNELVRLFYEICKRDRTSVGGVFKQIKINNVLEEGKGELFHRIKTRLLSERYPSMGKEQNPQIMPVKIKDNQKECSIWDFTLNPKTIFVEKSIKNKKWTKEFISQFPKSEVNEIDSMKKAMNKLSGQEVIDLYNSRRDRVFLIRSKSTFVKICPCTKGYKRCGYWILNLGFGCPMDCSYCYLQMYSNAPGLVFPANIEDFFDPILEFDKSLNKRTRIGTGEFTDSLALDRYTNFSSYLIPFFSKTKNLVLELKTKIADMENVLKQEPNDNVVISWTINPRKVAERYEKGGASLSKRIKAAKEVSEKGYCIGFHFDPVVYSKNWENLYKDVIKEMFSYQAIKEKTVWISLGTLRYTSGFKQIVEQRFSDNLIFYEGEFFSDTDEKLRYPRSLRIDMYNKMIKWIRGTGVKCWIYLCMEPEELWKKTVLKDRDYSYNP